ncbi:hypothetical protein NitaMp015 (mitochondrion) [Nicotiana tabacum]|uniref:Uncharacterized protein n=1 Tax=Nicotiana tabacum TaxID=4097 RepID=Q5MA52_TOBAC|nr:hypothetical protein NitaMp015 [Nicotiana tabacum]BAD83426.1 hypothetical protein [Nicotiana tabacum]
MKWMVRGRPPQDFPPKEPSSFDLFSDANLSLVTELEANRSMLQPINVVFSDINASISCLVICTEVFARSYAQGGGCRERGSICLFSNGLVTRSCSSCSYVMKLGFLLFFS